MRNNVLSGSRILMLIFTVILVTASCSSSDSDAGMDVGGSVDVEEPGDGGGEDECAPNCFMKECGDDGCGGTCGECMADGTVCEQGICKFECVGSCEGKECGTDGCGVSCGSCPAGASCVDGQCEGCEPDCEGKECGSDGCDANCGECGDDEECVEGLCVGEECPEAECAEGDTMCADGPAYYECAQAEEPCQDVWIWGGTAWECPDQHECEDGECICQPECGDKECGDDGCDGECGECPEDMPFCVDDACTDTCEPNCEGKECGGDGCGGDCGECAEGFDCVEEDDAATCVLDCEGPCENIECGPAGEDGACDCGGCNDNIDCTADSCEDGACVNAGDDALCDDDNICTDDACADTGCASTPNDAACDDGEECTVGDACADGECVPGEFNAEDVECSCCTENGCPDDGDLCTGIQVCDADTCICELDPDSVVACPQHENQCKSYACDPETGECVESDLAAGEPCDDGQVCTLDDECEEGVCLPGETDLNNPDCTNCCDVGCPADEDACNGSLMCNAESCLCEVDLDSVVECEEHDNPCMFYECAPATGECVEAAKPGGAECDDDDACTIDDQCDGEGECVGNGTACDDGDDCNGTEGCDPDTGDCIPGTPPDVDDGIACTADACADGAVTHTPDDSLCTGDDLCKVYTCDAAEGCVSADKNCDDNDVCTFDYCSGAGDCVNSPKNSDDQNPCTDNICDPIDGWSFPPNNDLTCDDGSACNGAEFCLDGECETNAPLNCDDGDDCTVDTCDEVEGCVHVTAENGTPCGDGGTYQCLAGECACVPDCTDKECGENGCGGDCGACGEGLTCIDYACANQYTCADMMQCGLGCNFSPMCILECYGNGSNESKALFSNFALCLGGECGLNATPACIAAATLGPCSAQYQACATDL